ncbi:MAG: V4R domain-containing protein [Anaerolineae bacterium]
MSIDHNAVLEAFKSVGLYGDSETGLIRRTGVLLSIAPVDYWVSRELDFIHRMGATALKLSENVLIDAAHWCAYGTFGSVMASPEWAAVIAPQVKTVHDRLDGLVAVTNCLGWGHISQYQLDEQNQTLELTVEHSYYVDYWVGKYGKAERPICHMWTGIAAGYMDLLFGSKVHEFTAEELVCAAVAGGTQCRFRAERLKRKFAL